MLSSKGHSNVFDLLKRPIDKNEADLFAVGEANLKIKGENLNVDYPRYNIKAKFMGNNEPAGLAIFIKSNLTYERLRKFETYTISMIELKIKRRENTYLYTVCI